MKNVFTFCCALCLLALTACGSAPKISVEASDLEVNNHEGVTMTVVDGSTYPGQVEVTILNTTHTVRGLPHGGKSLRQNVIQGLAVGKTLLELRGLGLKLCIGEGLVFIAQRLDLVHNGVDGFQLPGAVITKDGFQKSHRL